MKIPPAVDESISFPGSSSTRKVNFSRVFSMRWVNPHPPNPPPHASTCCEGLSSGSRSKLVGTATALPLALHNPAHTRPRSLVSVSLSVGWGYTMELLRGFHGGSDGKETACNEGDLGSIPGSGRPPGVGNGNPLQYSCLENSMDREAWQATV